MRKYDTLKFSRMGRPPKQFTQEDVIAIGERLLQWMKDCDADPNCDVVHLSEFYSEKEGIARTDWHDKICSKEYFHQYYDQARDWMLKRTMKNKNLPTAYGSRFLGLYSKQIREAEFELIKEKIDYEYEKKFEMEKALQINLPPNDNHISEKESLLKIIAEQQKAIHELQSKADQKHSGSE